jgi:hypothetical protein
MPNKKIFIIRLVLSLFIISLISGIAALIILKIGGSKEAAFAILMLTFSFLCMGAYDDNDSSCAFEDMLPKYKDE